MNQLAKDEENFSIDEGFIHKFDLFDLKILSSDRAHIALEIMQNHLKELIEFLKIQFYKFDNLAIKYIDQCSLDKQMCNSLMNFLTHFGKFTKEVRGANEKTQKTAKSLVYDISKILTPINSNDEAYSMNIIKEVELIKKEKSNLKSAIDHMAHLYLHTIFYNLNNGDDTIEISTIELLVALLFNTTVINPKIVKELIKDYNHFIEEISKFDPLKVRLDLAKDALLKIVNILKMIDPENLVNKKIAEKYKHLLQFAY